MSTKASRTDSAEGLEAWLAGRTEDELVDLLTLRPDAAGQLPGRMAGLADRLSAPASISRAGHDFDALTLAVVEVLSARPAPASVDEVTAALAGRAPAARVAERIELLRARALVRGPDDALTPVDQLAAALPWRLPQLTGPQPADATGLDAVTDAQRELLTRLADGPSLGRSTGAAPDAPPDHPVAALIAAGLLRRVDDETVELPLVIRAALRGDPPPPLGELVHPAATGTVVPDADGAGATAALELLRQADDLLAVLGETPAAPLRAGGIGIRELRRLAKAANLPDDRAGLLLELLLHAGLLAEGYPPGEEAPVFAPTVTVDDWLTADPRQRWADLAAAWLDLRRAPELIGRRTDDGVIGPLHPAARSAAAPEDRRIVLGALAAAEPGVAPDTDRLRAGVWFARPALQRRLDGPAVAAITAQAQQLGLVTAGALTAAGRALRAGEDPRAAMSAALPEPVTEFLLQADLTVTVPGPPDVEFGAALAEVAELESAGGAAVYRVTDASVRRALDAGRSPAEVHAFFAAHAVTPVPQALTYLIDDVARRHGRLRAGLAAAFLRSEDEALLAAVAASPVAAELGLRLLAPTVLISPAPLAELVAALRAAGFAVSGEDESGAVLDLRPAPVRLPARRSPAGAGPSGAGPAGGGPAGPGAGGLGPRGGGAAPSGTDRVRAAERARLRAEVAALLRRAETDRAADRGADVLPALTAAIREGEPVWIEHVDAGGAPVRTRVLPRELGQGRLVALADGLPRRYPLHRITAVSSASGD